MQASSTDAAAVAADEGSPVASLAVSLETMEETIDDMVCTTVSKADGNPPQQEEVGHVTTGTAGLATTYIPVSAPGGTSLAKEATNLSAASERTTDVGNVAGEASAVAGAHRRHRMFRKKRPKPHNRSKQSQWMIPR